MLNFPLPYPKVTKIKRKTLLLYSFLIILILGSATLSFAQNTSGFEFNSPWGLNGWQTSNITDAKVTNGKIIVKWERSARLFSPSGLGITPYKVLKIRARSDGDSAVSLAIRSGATNSIYIKHFWLTKGEKFRDYNFYINNIFPEEEHITSFAFEFTHSGTLEIDYIRFTDPRGLAFAAAIWNEFWTPDIVLNEMVNTVAFPAFGSSSFISSFYLLIAILIIVISATLIVRKYAFGKKALVIAVSISFLIVASIFTMRMDYKFLKIWQRDARIFSPIEPERRLTKYLKQDSNDFFDFLEFINTELPEGEDIRPTAKDWDALTKLAQFRLLPRKYSRNAKYLWSYNENNIHYKKKERKLMDGTKTIAAPVELVSTFRGRGTIYKIVKK